MRVAFVALIAGFVACSSKETVSSTAPPRAVHEEVERAMGALPAGFTALRSSGGDALQPLAVELSAHVDEAITFEAGGERLKLKPRGLRHAPIRHDRGTAIAEDVATHVDALWSAAADRAELYYVLRDAAAPTTFRFELEGAARTDTDGTIAVMHGDRRVMVIPRPYAIDANGVRRDAGMRLSDESELIVDLDARGLAYPIVLDPGVETAVWTKVAGTPRSHLGSCAAEAGGKLVLFGGRHDETVSAASGGTYSNETWEFDGTKWTKKLPATSPSARIFCYAAPLGSKVVLYGGANTTSFNDTWLWDGTNWTSGPAGPTYRDAAFFASTGSQVLLFGGTYGSAITYGDTWTFDGTAWTSRTGPAPSPRGSSRGGRIGTSLLLHAGYNGSTSYQDTWTWNGSAWTGYGDAPTANYVYTDGATAFIPITQYGTAAWVWNGASWVNTASALSGALPGVYMPQMSQDFAYTASHVFDGASASWAFGEGTGQGWGSIEKFAGGTWTSLASESGAPNGYAFTLGGELYVATTAGTTWKRSGTSWVKTMSTAAMASGPVIVADKPHLFDTVASLGHYRLDATGWVYVDNEPWSGPGVGTPSGELFVGGRYFDGSTWSNATNTDAGFGSTIAPGPKAIFKGNVVTQTSDGKLYKWNTTTKVWNLMPVPTTPAASDFLVAVGNRLVGLRKGATKLYDTLSIFDGTSWRSLSAPSGPPKIESLTALGSTIYAHSFVRGSAATARVGTGELWSLDIGYDNGTACTLASDCTSGFCTEGFCCEAASCGAGKSCATAAKGSCRKLNGQTCTAATECGTSVCAGGTCCATTCDLTTSTCSGPTKPGTCLLSNGQPATVGSACASGIVADGMCCDTACTGACRSCRAADTGGANGTCGNVTAGTDPGADCPDPADPNTCLADGYCDGAGKCRVYALDTKSCGASTCASGTVDGHHCNGSGACIVGTIDCAPFVCADATKCLSSCTTATDCKASGMRCVAGACVSLSANGKACASGDECASKSCVDGVCCNNACDGQCQSCNVAGSEGTCSAVKGAPVGGRPACSGAGTPCEGSCDGVASACSYPSIGTDCGTVCADGNYAEKKCDNKGTCVAKDPVSCNIYACAATGCKTSCSTKSDCATGDFECVDGKCVPPQPLACAADGVHIVQGDKTVGDCTPRRCQGGKCIERCVQSDSDCVAGSVCDVATGVCGPPPPDTNDPGCGCSTPGAPAKTSALVGGFAIAISLLRRRRARRG